MMTKVYKRTNLVVNTVKRLRNGCQQQAYLGKEWHIQLQSGEFRIQREVALEAKVKATSTERDNLVKENERLKKSTDRLKRQVTSLADQVRKAQNSGYQPTRGRSRNQSPSQCTLHHQRALKRKQAERCTDSLAWLVEAEGFSTTKVVLQKEGTGELEKLTLTRNASWVPTRVVFPKKRWIP